MLCTVTCTFLMEVRMSLQKERRLLENRRLDLDICKARLKKAKQAEAKAAVRGTLSVCVRVCVCPLFSVFDVMVTAGR